MATPLTYRGIDAEVRRLDGIYAGRLLVGQGGIVNFRADERDGVIDAFHAAVDAYLEDPESFLPPPPPEPLPPAGPAGPVELRYDTWRGAPSARRT